MATIKAGTYRFNDVLTVPSELLAQAVDFEYELDVTSVGGGVYQCISDAIAADTSDAVLFRIASYSPFDDTMEVGQEMPFYSDGVWFVDSVQTITIPNDTEVSAEFLTWFTANAVADGVQISGKWKFKDVLTIPMADFDFDEQIDFSVAVDYMGQKVSAFCDGIQIVTVGSDDDWRLIYNCITPPFDYIEVYVYWNMGRSWEDMFGEGIKTINFGTEPQTVSAEFYNWLTENASQPMASITHNGEEIASLFPGQTATLKCAGMKMVTDVVVEIGNIDVVAGEYDGDAVIEGEPTGGVGDANIVPLTVTENGVYDTYYETGTEAWDSNTEYAGSVTVDGVTLSFKKAEHLIVPDDLNELKKNTYIGTCEFIVDGETEVRAELLSDNLEITQGVCATYQGYAVIWVKQAAPLNAQFGISFLEDNTVYITNLMQMSFAQGLGATYVKTICKAPTKKVENVAYRPVTVALPISKDTLVRSINAGYESHFSTSEYYKYFCIKGPEVQQLTVTPSAVEQTFAADESKCFTSVTVGAVDLSDLSSMHILCGIYMKTLPQTQYAVGEWLNADGGVIVAQYTDGATAEVPLSHEYIWGFTTNNPGVIRLTVKYSEGGITSQTVYDITVT